ncbi:MAG: hypothetical protein A2Y82_03315 [Candidatus Buchananbacteria bacterium RBG_13_36_9]|uniref:Uncharacterized protein n=1 Tax=Candidatus Buchananbacteria bacterium RBG_13_36_9 TaxID=1797530 RepID=A0A1G1XNF6_9BACT|nr:MAG: hypothetical protein A2Y82_03315 [Candidatus Buchananbacteria bacterium RBG_13_36_9]
MNYTFEEFKAVKGKFTPSISITKTGGIGLSSGFCRRFTVNDYIGVKLYYDKNNNAVGLRFLKSEEEGMFKLKKGTANDINTGTYFMAKSFLMAYDLKKYAGKYPPEEIADEKLGKMFIIKLKKVE